MLEQMPGIHMYDQWKLIWEKYRHILKPNRKSPIELLNYVSRRYCLTEIHEQAALDTVRLNILMNEPLAQKLPKNSAPEPRTFYIEDVGNGKDLYTAVYKGTKKQDILRNRYDYRLFYRRRLQSTLGRTVCV